MTRYFPVIFTLVGVSLLVAAWAFGGDRGFGLISVRPDGTEESPPFELEHVAPAEVWALAGAVEGQEVLVLPRLRDPRGRDFRDRAVLARLGLSSRDFRLYEVLLLNRGSEDLEAPAIQDLHLRDAAGRPVAAESLHAVVPEQAEQLWLQTLAPNPGRPIAPGTVRRLAFLTSAEIPLGSLRSGEFGGLDIVSGTVTVSALEARLEGRVAAESLLDQVFVAAKDEK